MLTLFSVVFLTIFSPINTDIDSLRTKAVLLVPLGDERNPIGQPGQIVILLHADTSYGQHTIDIDGKVYSNVPDSNIVPFDADPVISKAYIIFQRKPVEDEMPYYTYRYLFLLSKNICALFPLHLKFEDIFALSCDYAAKYEDWRDEFKTEYSITIPLIDKYLHDYPNGKYRDKIEWELVRVKNHMYEYEGYADGPLQKIKAYETHLANHPHSTCADEIRLQIARLYRIASECIKYEDKNIGLDGFSPADAQKYLSKAIEYYNILLNSTNDSAKEIAQKALDDIKNNRNVYIDAP